MRGGSSLVAGMVMATASVMPAVAAGVGAESLPATGTAVPVPSGQAVAFLDMISDAEGPDGVTLRFRFVAPAISRSGGMVSTDEAQMDMQDLCDTFALKHLGDPPPAEIIISLSGRPVAFGEPDDTVTQFFGAYTVQGDHCEAELF